jgi:DNA-directed RNA polymerase specialized sigma24 family protein
MTAIHRSAEDVLEELWREHACDLMNLATVVVGPADAHDIVVEAFLGAAPSAGDRAIENVRGYLVRAVLNRAKDLHRSRHRRWRRDLAAVGPKSAAGVDSFVDVRRAVSDLSLGQRTVVYFVYWEDRTEAETAALLQISPGTVRRHLVRARDHLRRALQ